MEDFLSRMQEVRFLSYLNDFWLCLNTKNKSTCLVLDSGLGT